MLVDHFVDLGSPQSAGTSSSPRSKPETEEASLKELRVRAQTDLGVVRDLSFWLPEVWLLWLDRPVSRVFVGGWPTKHSRGAVSGGRAIRQWFYRCYSSYHLGEAITVGPCSPAAGGVDRFGSGIVVNVIKLLVPRLRPRHFDLEQSIWQSFEQAMLATERSGAIESFPSGHTATAFGLAIGLSWLWPEGRPVFGP